jgi:hypothetical protein
LTAWISASVSLKKWLMATTTGTPKPFTLATCRPRLAQPLRTASTFSAPRSALATPPFIFMARTVATITARGLQPRLAALDVEELLGAQVRAEAGLGHDILAQLQRRGGGDHAVAAMRDVGEGPAVDEGRVVLERLHEVGLHRVLESTAMAPSALRSRAWTGVLSRR